MPKQRIVIDIDTKDKPLYTGLEGKDGNYEALKDFFVGLEFAVVNINYGICPCHKVDSGLPEHSSRDCPKHCSKKCCSHVGHHEKP